MYGLVKRRLRHSEYILPYHLLMWFIKINKIINAVNKYYVEMMHHTFAFTEKEVVASLFVPL